MVDVSTPTVYVYTFSVWPDETWNFNKAVFDLFRMLTNMMDMNFTEKDFENFRSKLSHHGITLREVSRIPYVEPEIVW